MEGKSSTFLMKKIITNYIENILLNLFYKDHNEIYSAKYNYSKYKIIPILEYIDIEIIELFFKIINSEITNLETLVKYLKKNKHEYINEINLDSNFLTAKKKVVLGNTSLKTLAST